MRSAGGHAYFCLFGLDKYEGEAPWKVLRLFVYSKHFVVNFLICHASAELAMCLTFYMNTCYGFYGAEGTEEFVVYVKIFVVVVDWLDYFRFFLLIHLYFSLTVCSF